MHVVCYTIYNIEDDLPNINFTKYTRGIKKLIVLSYSIEDCTHELLIEELLSVLLNLNHSVMQFIQCLTHWSWRPVIPHSSNVVSVAGKEHHRHENRKTKIIKQTAQSNHLHWCKNNKKIILQDVVTRRLQSLIQKLHIILAIPTDSRSNLKGQLMSWPWCTCRRYHKIPRRGWYLANDWTHRHGPLGNCLASRTPCTLPVEPHPPRSKHCSGNQSHLGCRLGYHSSSLTYDLWSPLSKHS